MKWFLGTYTAGDDYDVGVDYAAIARMGSVNTLKNTLRLAGTDHGTVFRSSFLFL